MRLCQSCGRRLKHISHGLHYCLQCNPTRLKVVRLKIEKAGLPMKIIADMVGINVKTAEYHWALGKQIMHLTPL